MKLLFIDLETYSSVPLQDCGAAAYAASPDFRITLAGWAVDDRAPCSQEVMTPALVSMIESPEYIKVAHNAQFEMTCLAAAGVRICPEQWIDTMHIAARLGYPQGLQRLSAALYLGGSGKKDGARLIQILCHAAPSRQV